MDYHKNSSPFYPLFLFFCFPCAKAARISVSLAHWVHISDPRYCEQFMNYRFKQITLILILLLQLSVSYCAASSMAIMPPMPVMAVKPTQEKMMETQQSVGTLHANEAVMIKPEIEGNKCE